MRILFACALAMVIFSTPATASPIGAMAVYVAGDARVIPLKETKGTKITVGSTLSEGDRIKTTVTGIVEIEFDNGDLIRVDRNTELVIKSLHRDEKGSSFSIFDLVSGRVKSAVSKLAASDSKFEYHTKTAIVGTDGASPFVVEFSGYIVSVYFLGKSGDKESVYVQGFDSTRTMASVFAVTQPFATPGSAPSSRVPILSEKKVVSLRAGSRTFAVMGSAPSSPEQISPEEKFNLKSGETKTIDFISNSFFIFFSNSGSADK